MLGGEWHNANFDPTLLEERRNAELLCYDFNMAKPGSPEQTAALRALLGTELPEGAKLQVYVSTGLKEIEIPDVSNKTEEEAIKALVDAGFEEKNIKVKTEEHMTVKKDLVTRTDPEAGEGRNYKARITIYISTGVGKTFMPDIVGLSREDAEKQKRSITKQIEYIIEKYYEIKNN